MSIRPTLALIATTIVMTTLGCSKRESHVGRNVADSTLSHIGETTRPPRVEGTPVGANDSLINAIAPKLEPWVAMWRQAMPEFKPDSMIRVGVAPALRGPFSR